jgi:hypothetical protein
MGTIVGRKVGFAGPTEKEGKILEREESNAHGLGRNFFGSELIDWQFTMNFLEFSTWNFLAGIF